MDVRFLVLVVIALGLTAPARADVLKFREDSSAHASQPKRTAKASSKKKHKKKRKAARRAKPKKHKAKAHVMRPMP